MRVLITGGAGFIGSHLCDHFVQAGNSVTILDNFSTGSNKNLSSCNNKVKIVNGDIRNQKLVDRLISKNDLILHMAASLGVDNIIKKTIESISININGSEIVLKAATKYKKRIIIASTSEIYGKNPKQPLGEEDDRLIGNPQNFRWSYSDAKAIEESVAKVLHLEQGLKVTTLRFFNTIGPRQSANYGMVVPRFVERALNGQDLLVYGSGHQTRVFCHVADAVEAVVKIVEKGESIGQVYNVGGTGEVSIETLANEVLTITKSKSQIKKVPYVEIYPAGYEDMQRRVPDTTKLRNLVDWVPRHNLSSAILDIANFYKNK